MNSGSSAVVGGSIAGCTAAFALRRAGLAVEVFERSATPLVGRGASIILPQAVFETCRQGGLIGDGLPICPTATLTYIARAGDGRERWLGSLPFPGAAMHWSDLYTGLRAHVPDDGYHLGARVEGLDVDGERARLRLTDGRSADVDLAVFADGYRSIGRGVIDPDARTDRTNVMLIRGTTAETAADARLTNTGIKVLYPSGHGVFYVIPGEDGSIDAGRRRVSCSFYLTISDDDLAAQAALGHEDHDGNDQRIEGGRLPGDAPLLRRLLDRWLPAYFADLLRRTPNFFIQPILSITASRHVRGHACLAGDAGSMFPPYSNSGVAKAVTNALSLEKALAGGDSIPEVLRGWNAEQQAADETIAVAAERFGRLLVHDVPDLGAASVSEANAYLMRLHPEAILELPDDD